jgi:hypothetical protein
MVFYTECIIMHIAKDQTLVTLIPTERAGFEAAMTGDTAAAESSA